MKRSHKTLLTLYIIGALVSWLLIAGWQNAKWQNDTESRVLDSQYYRQRDHGHALLFATIGTVVWPFAVPFVYVETGYAYYGWQLSHD